MKTIGSSLLFEENVYIEFQENVNALERRMEELDFLKNSLKDDEKKLIYLKDTAMIKNVYE